MNEYIVTIKNISLGCYDEYKVIATNEDEARTLIEEWLKELDEEREIIDISKNGKYTFSKVEHLSREFYC